MALFCLLYGPRLIWVDVMTAFTAILAAVAVVSYIKNGVAKINLAIVWSLITLIFLSSMHYAFTGYAETTLLEIFSKLLLYYISASFLFERYRTKFLGDTSVIVKHVLLATVINGIFVIAVYFLPVSIKEQLRGIFDYSQQEMWLLGNRRMFDLSLGGGATASFTFALVFYMAFALPKNSRPNAFFTLVTIVAVAAALMGRTGLYFIMVIVGFVFLSRSSKVSAGSVLSLLAIFSAVSWILFLNWQEFLHSEYYAWATEDFYGASGTRLALGEMWFMPSDHVLFGDGYFGRIFPHIIYSDVGYVRALHAVGVVGATLMYGWLIYLAFISRGTLRLSGGPDQRNVFYAIILMLLVMNMKELHFASRGTSVLLFIAFCWSRDGVSSRFGKGGASASVPFPEARGRKF